MAKRIVTDGCKSPAKLTLTVFVLALLVAPAMAQSGAQERAARLRAQLTDLQAQQADLQSRLTQLDEDIKPENIERSLAGVGSTHPEDLREEALEERIITGSDCRCTNHFGPHWLYQDYQWYERNLKLLERCARHVQGLNEWGLVRDQDPTASSRGRQQRQGAELAYRAFALEEIPRLREKIYLMTSLHIESISYDMLGPAFEDLSAREHAILARNIELFQKIAGKAVVS